MPEVVNPLPEHGIAYVKVARGKKPWRIKNREKFGALVRIKRESHEPVFSTPVSYRLEMLGFSYEQGGSALHVVRKPLYDTEFVAGVGDNYYMWETLLFATPMGMNMARTNQCKTELETNMIMSGELPVPNEFDLFALRSSMDPRIPLADRLAVYYGGTLRLQFAAGVIIWEGPLSMIPCGSLLEHKELRPPGRVKSSVVLDEPGMRIIQGD